MGGPHAHPLHHHGHGPVHRLPPEAKVAAVIGFVVAVALTRRGAMAAYAVDAAVVVAVVVVAGLPGRFVAARLAIVLPFLLFAATVPFVASGPTVAIGGVEVSREGLVAAGTIAAKSLLGAAASIVLAATTEEHRILVGLQRLRAPAALVTIAMVMLRYLDVIAGEFRRTRTAMSARGYTPRWLGDVRPLAQATGTLFVRSFERGERVHDAMRARGFTGTLPTLDQRRATGREWVVAAAPAAVAAIAALASWTVA